MSRRKRTLAIQKGGIWTDSVTMMMPSTNSFSRRGRHIRPTWLNWTVPELKKTLPTAKPCYKENSDSWKTHGGTTKQKKSNPWLTKVMQEGSTKF